MRRRRRSQSPASHWREASPVAWVHGGAAAERAGRLRVAGVARAHATHRRAPAAPPRCRSLAVPRGMLARADAGAAYRLCTRLRLWGGLWEPRQGPFTKSPASPPRPFPTRRVLSCAAAPGHAAAVAAAFGRNSRAARRTLHTSAAAFADAASARAARPPPRRRAAAPRGCAALFASSAVWLRDAAAAVALLWPRCCREPGARGR